MKILNIVGARPNLVKMAPLMREMGKRANIEPLLVHTGQHYDDTLSDVFFRQMDIPRPDVNLEVGSGSHSWQTAEILKRIEPVLLKEQPDLVLVVGDVNSTVAVSLAAAKLGMPVAHVEAGLRSFDRTMPEEINRILTDALADYMFVTEEGAVANLLKEGRPRDRIYFVGNVMIDALYQFLPLAKKSTICQELDLATGGSTKPFAVLTLHRPASVDSMETLERLLDAIDIVAEDVPVIFPVHPRTQQRLENLGKKHHDRVCLIQPLGYLDFLCLLNSAKIVLTDSGGVQEETTALGVPCLTLRDNTERPVTISLGTNQLVGRNQEQIVGAAKRILSDGAKPACIPPLWDGGSSQRIVEILLEEIHLRPQPAEVATS